MYIVISHLLLLSIMIVVRSYALASLAQTALKRAGCTSFDFGEVAFSRRMSVLESMVRAS